MSDQPKEQNLHRLKDNLLELRDGLLELQSALEKLHRALQYKQRNLQGTGKPEGMGNSGGILFNTSLPLKEDPAALTDMVRRMADNRSPGAETKNRK